MRLLVVEDEKKLCDMIAKSLHQAGYEVDTCNDGEEALEMICAEMYDLIVLDLNLPGMDGMDILRELRKENEETKVLILSARSQIADKVEGLDAGANDYMEKPFHIKELEARIRSLTRRKFVQKDVCLESGGISFDTIKREAYAKEILRQTSYYSLIGGYKDIFKNPTTKKYKDGTRFEDIVELYYFDELLRQLFLRYLIKVENGIKSQVSYYFTEKNGENQKEYLDTSNYNYSGKKNQRDIDRLIKKLEGYVTKSTDYHYINHSQKKYGNVPLWVLTNALTFGNISKMYMLLPQDIQIKVSRNYQCVNEKQMVSILAVLVKYRNVCAHGERLFTYRTADSIPDLPIHRKLKIAQKGSQYVNGKNDLFSVVIALRYMLNDQWYKEFIKELKTLIDKYLKKHDSISEQELYEKMGFPENWRKITRYRKI